MGVAIISNHRFLLLIVLATIVVSPSVFVGYEWSRDFLFPITLDSLEFKVVELGDLQMGEKRTIACTLRNRSWRSLHLLPPRLGCGCLSLVNAPTVLNPGESGKLEVEFQAPKSPDAVARTILLQARDFPRLEWKVGIRGQVVATVWAEPDTVFLDTDEAGFAETTLRIRHDEATPVGNISVSSSAISLEPLTYREGIQRIRVSVSNQADRISRSGHTTIDVMSNEEPTRKLLSIPVRWRPRSLLKWVPQALDIGEYGNASDRIRRNILIYGIAGKEGKLNPVPLVPWLKIEKRDRLGSAVRLQFIFDPSAMPDQIDHDVLRLEIGDDDRATVHAYGKR